jgi:hypothetical protein
MRIAGRSGFVLPIVVMVLVLMAAMAITLVGIGQEEGKSARAMRESALAFYAAEAGVNQVRATLPDSVLRGLEPGDSVDLGWGTLAGGASYHAKVMRFDNAGGGQALYGLIVDGRAPGPQGGRRTVSVMITSSPGSRYRLGLCCDAALTIRGEVSLSGGALVDGTDEVPDGWSETCPDSGQDVPGIIMADTTAISIGNATVTGDPPLVEDSDLADSSFDQFGELSYDSIRIMRDHVIRGEPTELVLDGRDGNPIIQSSHVWDPDIGKWVCDTSDPYNWGSNDPFDPCFNYFPIILIQGEVEVHDGYGQAVVIIDWDDRKPAGEKGGEFELETDFTFNGLILGKGCVEIQKGADFHGAVFVDANYRNEDLCGGDSDYDMNDDQPVIQWSQCAVNRSIEATGLYEYAETDSEPAAPLGSRAFLDLIH